MLNPFIAIPLTLIFVEGNPLENQLTGSHSSDSTAIFHSNIWLGQHDLNRILLTGFLHVSLLLSSINAKLANGRTKAVLSLGLHLFSFYYFLFVLVMSKATELFSFSFGKESP